MNPTTNGPQHEMKRRKYLASAIFAASASLAGCLSEFGDDEPEPQDDVGTASYPESDANDGENESEESEELDDRDNREQILDLYNDGVSESNQGISNRERGVNAWNSDDYSTAESRFNSAESRFSNAQDEFSEALDLTYEIGHSEAREICESGSEYAIVMQDAMQASQRMADAGADGDADRANDHLETTRNLESEADRLNVRDTSVLKSVLDL